MKRREIRNWRKAPAEGRLTNLWPYAEPWTIG